MIVHTCEQRSPEWHALRLGRLTSSGADAMLSENQKDKKKESTGRRNLRVRLALERITGQSLERDFLSGPMKDGIEREADALALYEALTGQLISTVGFVEHDTLMAGASPDGYVGDFDILVEAKAPMPATHLEYLTTGRVPLDYMRQIFHHLWIVPQAQRVDWISFCPFFPEPLQMKLVQIDRDDLQMKAYDTFARQFLGEVERQVEEIQRMADAAEGGLGVGWA